MYHTFIIIYSGFYGEEMCEYAKTRKNPTIYTKNFHIFDPGNDCTILILFHRIVYEF